jgi:hypothetical protein
VADTEGVVENGKAAIKWTVVYTEDKDDSTSGKDLTENGYTLPEYHFVAEYGGQESGQSPVLKVKGWIERQAIYEGTKEVIANRKYVLILPDNTKINGTTDEDGVIKELKVPIGKTYGYFAEE